MNRFDIYEPYPQLDCPACGKALDGWKGKDGPCGQFVWRQGVEAPIAQDVDEEFLLPAVQRERMRLPPSFSIHARCCSDRFMVTATGYAETDYAGDNLWDRTELETAETLERGELTSEEYEAKHAWLAGEGNEQSPAESEPEVRQAEPILVLTEPVDPEPEAPKDLRREFDRSMQIIQAAQSMVFLSMLGLPAASFFGPKWGAFGKVLIPICIFSMLVSVAAFLWFCRCPGCGFFLVWITGDSRPSECARCGARLSDDE
ncbi:hypothetical protein ABI59_12880 [Acidobacteria bacterium Mor1]|nr:hypothetical protein ABI59_12880 [Acidobacteria bacterium Mor1]